MPSKSPTLSHYAKSQFEVLQAIEPAVKTQIPQFLKTVEESWQASEFLPDLSSEKCRDELTSFQKEAALAPKELFVVLIGNMVTEEALPSYQSWFNSNNFISDKSGT